MTPETRAFATWRHFLSRLKVDLKNIALLFFRRVLEEESVRPLGTFQRPAFIMHVDLLSDNANLGWICKVGKCLARARESIRTRPLSFIIIRVHYLLPFCPARDHRISESPRHSSFVRDEIFFVHFSRKNFLIKLWRQIETKNCRVLSKRVDTFFRSELKLEF